MSLARTHCSTRLQDIPHYEAGKFTLAFEHSAVALVPKGPSRFENQGVECGPALLDRFTHPEPPVDESVRWGREAVLLAKMRMWNQTSRA
jgi:hypothetical protein